MSDQGTPDRPAGTQPGQREDQRDVATPGIDALRQGVNEQEAASQAAEAEGNGNAIDISADQPGRSSWFIGMPGRRRHEERAGLLHGHRLVPETSG